MIIIISIISIFSIIIIVYFVSCFVLNNKVVECTVLVKSNRNETAAAAAAAKRNRLRQADQVFLLFVVTIGLFSAFSFADLWRGRSGTVARIRVGAAVETEAVAHVEHQGPRAVHPHAAVAGRRAQH